MHFAIALLLATLATGVTLDPASQTNVVGNFPLAAAASADGRFIALLLCGWREQGIQIVDRNTGSVTQTIAQPAAFIGLTFSPDGHTLYASGGNDDVVYVYRWSGDRAAEDGTIVLRAKKDSKSDGTSYPAGLVCSPDGRFLYVAENLGDSVVVIDTASRQIVQRIVTDRYPYAVAVDTHHLYVSCWGDQTVNAFAVSANGTLGKRSRIAVARHPSALLLSGNRLFVTSSTTDSISVVDVTTSKVVKTFRDAPPAGAHEGSTPNALAISADGKRLFVAEADNNAVALLDTTRGTLLGRVPTEWYPASLVRIGNDVVVVNAKGRGTHANPGRVQPDRKNPPGNRDHILGQFEGTLMSFSANVTASQLSELTQRVGKANGWD
ncbi:MAG TPA: beta-propeller fold lactonase family protein, partial [Thermoanaerobaculia bacterium]